MTAIGSPGVGSVLVEVAPGLWVGDQVAYETAVKGVPGWRIVHACKEPYHRALLGYSGRAAPKDHPEYLWAERGDQLFLNLVDAPDPAYVPAPLVEKALAWIHDSLVGGSKVLVHCNVGESRSPTLALLYLATYTDGLPRDDLVAAEVVFRSLYPRYAPGLGMRGFLAQHWGGSVAQDGREG